MTQYVVYRKSDGRVLFISPSQPIALNPEHDVTILEEERHPDTIKVEKKGNKIDILDRIPDHKIPHENINRVVPTPIQDVVKPIPVPNVRRARK